MNKLIIWVNAPYCMWVYIVNSVQNVHRLKQWGFIFIVYCGKVINWTAISIIVHSAVLSKCDPQKGVFFEILMKSFDLKTRPLFAIYLQDISKNSHPPQLQYLKYCPKSESDSHFFAETVRKTPKNLKKIVFGFV